MKVFLWEKVLQYIVMTFYIIQWQGLLCAQLCSLDGVMDFFIFYSFIQFFEIVAQYGKHIQNEHPKISFLSPSNIKQNP